MVLRTIALWSGKSGARVEAMATQTDTHARGLLEGNRDVQQRGE